MKKILALIIITLFATGSIIAQNLPKHEISVWGAGGLSTLKYSIDAGDNKNGMGCSFGAGYNYFFSDRWSIGTGLEVSLYNGKAIINDYYDSYDSNDGEYDFEFRTTVTDYEEKQDIMLLNIPVMVQYQLPTFSENLFYIAGGFKFGIPVTKKYKITNITMDNSGFYPIWSDEKDLILDSQEFMGFGKFNHKDIKGDLNLKAATILSLETGIKWKTGNASSLYTGAYLDYGLNGINKKDGKRLVQYNASAPEDFVHSSIMQTETAGKARVIACGVKIRMAFGL